MPYLTYSTGYGKHYNTIYPYSFWSTLNEAVNEMRDLLKEGRPVKVFSKPVNVDLFKVINLRNKRIIRRK
jgi:hypothetical protein